MLRGRILRLAVVCVFLAISGGDLPAQSDSPKIEFAADSLHWAAAQIAPPSVLVLRGMESLQHPSFSLGRDIETSRAEATAAIAPFTISQRPGCWLIGRPDDLQVLESIQLPATSPDVSTPLDYALFARFHTFNESQTDVYLSPSVSGMRSSSLRGNPLHHMRENTLHTSSNQRQSLADYLVETLAAHPNYNMTIRFISSSPESKGHFMYPQEAREGGYSQVISVSLDPFGTSVNTPREAGYSLRYLYATRADEYAQLADGPGLADALLSEDRDVARRAIFLLRCDPKAVTWLSRAQASEPDPIRWAKLQTRRREGIAGRFLPNDNDDRLYGIVSQKVPELDLEFAAESAEYLAFVKHPMARTFVLQVVDQYPSLTGAAAVHLLNAAYLLMLDSGEGATPAIAPSREILNLLSEQGTPEFPDKAAILLRGWHGSSGAE